MNTVLNSKSNKLAQPKPLSQWHGRLYAITGLSIFFIIIIGVATAVGSTDISIDLLGRLLISRLIPSEIDLAWPGGIETIIFDIRLPRVILAGIVGAALSVAGATYQGLFRNPLADPYLIGVAQGASLGAVIGFLLPATKYFLGIGIVPVFAFTGAIIATGIVYGLSRSGRNVAVTTLILAGVALSALLSSIVSYLIIFSGESIHGIVFWLMGSFASSKWTDVQLAIPYIAAGTIVILICSRQLNVMQLDEEQAQQLGVNVERLKIILLIAATLITAAAVAFVGTIGFVGIIVPHAMRLIWGADHRFLLPLSILSGAIFMIIADLIARTALSPLEIPIGVITALFGAPFFLYLLRRQKKVIF